MEVGSKGSSRLAAQLSRGEIAWGPSCLTGGPSNRCAALAICGEQGGKRGDWTPGHAARPTCRRHDQLARAAGSPAAAKALLKSRLHIVGRRSTVRERGATNAVLQNLRDVRSRLRSSKMRDSDKIAGGQQTAEKFSANNELRKISRREAKDRGCEVLPNDIIIVIFFFFTIAFTSPFGRLDMTAPINQSGLEALLDSSRIGVLDGGLATYLEDGLNFDLSKGPLWSARLLDEKEEDVSNGKGQKGIFDAHLHYLQAGCGYHRYFDLSGVAGIV
ncbi:hypothetical protein L1887_57107 [Cichorium endivia]|nr:hypothetical protein L1887_57107 [Cichorium endivia]